MTQRTVTVQDFAIGEGCPLAIMAGPCAIESESHSLKAAEALKAIFAKAGIKLIFKSSYDKANRSSINSFRGPGIDEGLRILSKIRRELDLPIVTDVHSPQEATAAGEVCDIIQIPAFLCRQTDLIVAAAQTKAVINIKKGQFMAPHDMKNAIEKVNQAGNSQVIITDRGTCFGYNNLVSDMRSIPIMQGLGAVVCFDATHSVQLPGGNGVNSGGERQFIATLAKAAIASGADCLFIEAHDNPSEAKSDRDSVLDFKDLPMLLNKLKRLYEISREP